jgi:glycosyltransferase involved in cell wall biosynthesis
MRIVHVVQGLGVGEKDKRVVQLSRELASRGHEPVIVSLTRAGEWRAEVADVPVYDVPRGAVADPTLAGVLAVLLSHLAPDVVHTHDLASMFRAVPAALLVRVRRRVHTKHAAGARGRRAIWASRTLVRALDAVIVGSQDAAAAARVEERVPPSRLHIVPHGLPLDAYRRDPEARERVRRALRVPVEAFVVGSIGVLGAERDYSLLVRSLAPILGELVRLVLVGGGEDRAAIERAIPRGAAPFVTLTGVRRDVPALLASFDAFVLASRTEGLPPVVPEAMASELPVIATAAGELAASVPADCGVIVPPGQQGPLALAVGTLARDRGRARRMGKAARRHALARFSMERTVEAHEHIYAGT